MLSENNKTGLVRIKSFIKPEDFLYDAVYLLFSKDRSKERYFASEIKEAFREANLTPNRFVVERRIIFLECTGYEIAFGLDKLLSVKDPVFTRFAMPAQYRIPAGEIPQRANSEDLEKVVYNFKQDL